MPCNLNHHPWTTYDVFRREWKHCTQCIHTRLNVRKCFRHTSYVAPWTTYDVFIALCAVHLMNTLRLLCNVMRTHYVCSWMMHDLFLKSSCVQRMYVYTLRTHIHDAWPIHEVVMRATYSCLHITHSHMMMHDLLMIDSTTNAAPTKSTKSTTQIFRYTFKSNQNLNLDVYSGVNPRFLVWWIWETPKFPWKVYHTCMAHDALIMNTSHVIMCTH